MKLLTIGNSFSWSLRSCLPAICQDRQFDLELEFANHGGCEMRRHWSYVTQEENDPFCRMYQKKEFKLRELLSSRLWDIVTIQQASHESWQSDTFQPWGDNLIGYIKKYAPQAEIVIQQTWAYREDAPRLTEWGIDVDTMHQKIVAAYQEFQRHTQLRLIPTGQAVQLARQEEPVKFVNYPPKQLNNLTYPDLPDQRGSIVGNIRWLRNHLGAWQLYCDTIHLNLRGEYLQGAVWYGFLAQDDPRRIAWHPDDLTAEDSEFLRDIAYHTLRDYA